MNLIDKIQQKIDNKTKPVGALGLVEDIALQVCKVQQTLTPRFIRPTIVVFAGDHGIAKSGVSAYPSSVTSQMVLNFLNGGAAINVFSKQQGIDLKIVDVGVDFDFEIHPNLINAKINRGTRNFLDEKAMREGDLEQCFEQAGKIVDDLADGGCNVIGFGEMGIGNTSSAAILMSSLCDLPIERCAGVGTGLEKAQLQKKIALLEQAQSNFQKPKDGKEALEFFGGYEIAHICGAMLQSYRRNMVFLVDGFIASAAFLCAYTLCPEIMQNALFCHQSDERGHKEMLNYLKVKPILNLEMRLGEGTGCAIAYPIILSAVNFMNEMASFEDAGVSGKNA